MIFLRAGRLRLRVLSNRHANGEEGGSQADDHVQVRFSLLFFFLASGRLTLSACRQVKQDIIINEIQIMKDSHHHAIVNYIDSYIVEGTLWVVMELINGGSLAELIEVGSLLPFLCVCVCVAVALAHRRFLLLARCARR